MHRRFFHIHLYPGEINGIHEWMAMMAMKQDCNLQKSYKYYTMMEKRHQANLLVLERRILPEEPLPALAGGLPLYCRFPNPVRAGKISLLL
jgi:hypothetical protein